ncbi:hypothetical protein [Sphingomonas morindae]|uniref:Lipopolysaccharide assembly protein A domain-containing protein n=1 Tax=Sphingomonas morindae TaxID=1541170 RepID=A0ABY4X5K8_9SPHN|nr:hypothetical protein [Sphingomonas morindae]USI72187.1 hypothetical protein LHA26_12860 [Sphingomonas morindae]
MQFLKTLFWVVLATAAVVFAMHNWTPILISLWGGLLVEAKLPVLLYGAFLLGLLPALAWHGASRWRAGRRIDALERALAEVRIAAAPPPAPVPAAPSAPPSTAMAVAPLVVPAAPADPLADAPPAQS